MMRWKSVALTGLVLAAGLVLSFRARAGRATPSANPHPPERPTVAAVSGLPEWEPPRTAAMPAVRLATSVRLATAVRLATNDECTAATPVTLTLTSPQFAEGVLTASATISDTDPIQSCSWGGPAVNSRSVWWRVTVPEDGRLTASTVTENPNRYDTVVAIHPAEAGCGSLSAGTELGCDDDTRAFQSRASALVDAGQAYLVEITEWGDAEDEGDQLELDLILSFAWDTHWQSPPGTGLPIPLTRHVAVSDGSYLYVLGGQNSGLSQKVFRYDPSGSSWSQLTEMPVSYSNTDGAYLDGRVYVPTGYAGDAAGSPYGGVHYVYDITENVWSTASPITATVSITEPPGWGAAAGDPSGAAYYYTGGRRGTDYPDFVPLSDVARYDVISDTWAALRPMKTPRYAHGAAFVGDRLCVVGGIGDGGQLLSSGECFDLASQDWYDIEGLNLPRALFGSAVGADGRWYVFGGAVGGSVTTPKMEVYDAGSNQWTPLDQRWSLRQSRDWPAAARVGVSVYATGGYQQGPKVVVSTLESLIVGSSFSHLPLVTNRGAAAVVDSHEPNDALPLAYGPLASGVPVASSFAASDDRDDFFFFVQSEITATVQVTLASVPAGSDYELYLYGKSNGNAKAQLAYSDEPGNADEQLSTGLPSGTYYIRVRNPFPSLPSTEPYSLVLTVH